MKTKSFKALAKELLTDEQIARADFNVQLRYQMMTEVSVKVKKQWKKIK